MSRIPAPHALQVALQHHQAGRLAQAQVLYEQVLAQHPDHADALHLCGLIAHQRGQHASAAELIQRAIALKPNFPQAYCNLGNVLRDMGQPDAAIAACRRAIAFRPGLPEAHCNLGNALQDAGRVDEALAAYREAIALRPDYPEALSNLAAALRGSEHLDEAITACRRAITLRPGYAEAHSNLGIALHENRQLEEAIAAYREALALRVDLPETHYNLGTALRDQGRLDDAIAAFNRAIALRPDYPEAHYLLGMALLLKGEFRAGWREYEWRLRCRDFPPPKRTLDRPRWDGSDLHGGAVFVYAEQGFGDTFQFVRCLQEVGKRGGRVIFGCDASLRNLLGNVAGVDDWVSIDEVLPSYRAHCSLMSLPSILEMPTDSLAGFVPYIEAAPEVVERWRNTLGGDVQRLKVGLVWAGRPTHRHDHNRSLTLSAFASLAGATGVCFYSLQKGDRSSQAANPPAGMSLVDRTSELADFAETAALIASLDLVISVDTAVAHLAGAMGKPVWVMLPFVPDWRWLLDREDSLWYPTMRLFRQPAIGDWDSVMARVASALCELAASQARGASLLRSGM